MNIWYFHHYGTPYEIPGLHRPFEYGTYFNRSGNKTAVFTSSYLHYSGKNMITDKSKSLLKQYDGVEAVFVKTCGYNNSKVKRVINMAEYALRLKSTAKWFSETHWKPDIIIASSPDLFTLTAGLKIAKQYGVPCVCEIRDFWPEVFFLGGVIKESGLIGKALLRLERRIYEKADTILFLKEGDHTYITDKKWDTAHGGKINMIKCAYVNNGVDIRLFDRRMKEHVYSDAELDNRKFTVVYCGTIRPVNNIDMLLDVAKIVGNDVQFLIFGTGNCVDDLKKRIENEHIENVYLKGYVDNQYIPSILSRSSVNILNYSGSTYNWSRGNSSNKLFEYLASGKPVLSTVKMGYDLLERFNCGYSAEHCTAEEIADLIRKIKALPRKEYDVLCENARTTAEKFDIPVLAKEYLDVLSKTNMGGSKK